MHMGGGHACTRPELPEHEAPPSLQKDELLARMTAMVGALKRFLDGRLNAVDYVDARLRNLEDDGRGNTARLAWLCEVVARAVYKSGPENHEVAAMLNSYMELPGAAFGHDMFLPRLYRRGQLE